MNDDRIPLLALDGDPSSPGAEEGRAVSRQPVGLAGRSAMRRAASPAVVFLGYVLLSTALSFYPMDMLYEQIDFPAPAVLEAVHQLSSAIIVFLVVRCSDLAECLPVGGALPWPSWASLALPPSLLSVALAFLSPRAYENAKFGTVQVANAFIPLLVFGLSIAVGLAPREKRARNALLLAVLGGAVAYPHFIDEETSVALPSWFGSTMIALSVMATAAHPLALQRLISAPAMNTVSALYYHTSCLAVVRALPTLVGQREDLAHMLSPRFLVPLLTSVLLATVNTAATVYFIEVLGAIAQSVAWEVESMLLGALFNFFHPGVTAVQRTWLGGTLAVLAMGSLAYLNLV